VAVLILQAALGLWLFAGCATVENPAPGNLAWVRIEGRTDDQVHSVICSVFDGKGYKNGYDSYAPGAELYRLKFEKVSSRMNRWAYGALLESGVQERIRIVVTRANNNWLITLDAFMVSNAGSSFEEEHKLSGMTHDTYAQLLDAIKARLQ
jgi:hypothetical protein